MNFARIIPILMMVGCLLSSQPVSAQDLSPFGLSKQFNADMTVTNGPSDTITQKIYTDNGKIRTETTIHGMQIDSIIRPDLKKIYSVMVTQKTVMEMAYDPDKVKQQLTGAAGPQGKAELVGPDAVENVACTKYKVTSDNGKVYFFWVDTTNKVPVKMAAEDNSVLVLWKNYHAGPQDPALFELPADFKVMPMPSLPTLPPPSGTGQ